MAIKTLFDYWTDRKVAADLAVKNAQDSLTLAQTTLATARNQLSAGNADLAARRSGPLEGSCRRIPT